MPTRFEVSTSGLAAEELGKLEEEIWRHVTQHWPIQCASPNYAPLQVLQQIPEDLMRGKFWLNMFYESRGTRPKTPQKVMQNTHRWQRLRRVFVPTLFSVHEIVKHERVLCQLTEFRLFYNSVITRKDLGFTERIGDRNRISFSLYSELDMSYMLARYPRIVELGAGSCYFASEFANRGGDIIAIDIAPESGPYRIQEWGGIEALGERFVPGDTDKIGPYADGRALLIRWPQPRSPMVYDALRKFCRAGGKDFIFQPGSWAGRLFNAAGEIQSPGHDEEALVQGLDYLADHFTEVRDADTPPFHLKGWDDNIFYFRVKG